ncbi:HDOD domain-containing protein [Engelhardtia mirabilis]|uniref:HDOD domain protein n=1 Tax=Engelhardtia mirabilis TaxID=2528011 RepID=A0A518BSC4_9BACT|nr:HDOD domain protein [Planctomycetes bacterium Pla133]QDV04197.1 HDOD domain protein [Planctomycetes bacterium Pla86]
MTNRDQVLEAVQQLPPIPVDACELVRLLQDPEVDPAELERAISLNPALTTHVLATANSAIFGARAEISTVRRAWLQLGSGRIQAAVMSAMVGPMACEPVEGYSLPGDALWEGALAIALATEELALKTGGPPPNEAFTAGLLVDIGKTVFGQVAQTKMSEIADLAFGGNISFEKAEEQLVGINHAEAGAIMLEAWGLPESIIQVVRWHHEPEMCPEEFRPIAELVHAAQYLCGMVGLGNGEDGNYYASSEAVFNRLGLSPDAIENCLCQTLSKLDLAREAFGLEKKS